MKMSTLTEGKIPVSRVRSVFMLMTKVLYPVLPVRLTSN